MKTKNTRQNKDLKQVNWQAASQRDAGKKGRVSIKKIYKKKLYPDKYK